MKLFIALLALVTFSHVGAASANESVQFDVTAQFQGADGGFYNLKQTVRAEFVAEKPGLGVPPGSEVATAHAIFAPPLKAAGNFDYKLLLMVFRNPDGSGLWPGRLNVDFMQTPRGKELAKDLIPITLDLHDTNAIDDLSSYSWIVLNKKLKAHVTLFVTNFHVVP